MHSISTLILFVSLIVVLNCQSAKHRSCPEEYRELRHRNDESDSDSEEDLCEQAMTVAARQNNPLKSQLLVHTYCPYYDEVAKLAMEKDDELCEKKKRQIKRKRNYDDDDDSDDDDSSSDSDEKKKRRGLGRRQLRKRLALRFLQKRLA